MPKVPCLSKSGASSQIDTDLAIRHAFAGHEPPSQYERALDEIVEHVKSHAKSIGFPQPTQSAFNNVRGSWFEYLVEVDLWNFLRAHDDGRYACLSIPNVSGFNLADLFDDDTRDKLGSLRESLQRNGVEMITSNPDFLFVRDIKLPKRLNRLIGIEDMLGKTPFSTRILEEIKGKLRWNQLTAGLSLKASLRPDRRLQVSHEGNVLKSLFEHLRMRNWDSTSKFRYYCAALSFNPADQAALRTAATHTIVNVASEPEPAVDQIFAITSAIELRRAAQHICR